MTRTATGPRQCSQHHQLRSECRPEDRHTQPLRCSDALMAAVAAKAEAAGLTAVNDALEMALEAWVRAPLQAVAEQALADRRIRRLPAGLNAAAGKPAAIKAEAAAPATAPAAAKSVRFVEPKQAPR